MRVTVRTGFSAGSMSRATFWAKKRFTGSEEVALKTSPDYDWQRDLWVRLAENPRWKGLQFLENFVGNLKRLAESQEDAALTEVLLDEDRRIKLPDTARLHAFCAPAPDASRF